MTRRCSQGLVDDIAHGIGRRRDTDREVALAAVLDHLLVDLISTIQRSFDQALLQRQAVENGSGRRLLGDVSWETSYSFPARSSPHGCRRSVGGLADVEPDLVSELVDR